MQVSTMQTKDRRRSIKAIWTTLRNQKLRRVQQKPIIDRKRAAERRLHPETKPHRVRPMRAQVCGIDRR